MHRHLLATVAVSVLLVTARALAATTVVQVPIDSLLNGRSVSTLTGGAVVQWSDGVDMTDGLMTNAAVAFLKQTGVALPDNGVFAADSNHPEVVLHFSNDAPVTRKQVFYLHGTGTFHFATPRGTYAKLWVFLLSSIGDSPLTVTYSYDDGGTTQEKFTVPDWGTGAPLPKTPPIFFNLIAGMHKWDQMDRSIDAPVHTITGVLLSPAPDRVLTNVQVDKPNAGQYLTFWGATGLATLVDGGDGGVDAAADTGADSNQLSPADGQPDRAEDLSTISDTGAPPPSDVPAGASPDASGAPSDVRPGGGAATSSGCSLAAQDHAGALPGCFIFVIAWFLLPSSRSRGSSRARTCTARRRR